MWHSDEIWIQDSTKQLTVDFEEKLQQWYKSQVVLFLRWGYFVMDSKQYWFHLTAFTYSTEYKLLIILSPTVQKKNPSRVADKSIRSVYKMTVWCNILLTFCFFFFFLVQLSLSLGVCMTLRYQEIVWVSTTIRAVLESWPSCTTRHVPPPS